MRATFFIQLKTRRCSRYRSRRHPLCGVHAISERQFCRTDRGGGGPSTECPLPSRRSAPLVYNFSYGIDVVGDVDAVGNVDVVGAVDVVDDIDAIYGVDAVDGNSAVDSIKKLPLV